jgi:CBS domain containing-hemolysin-like protein
MSYGVAIAIILLLALLTLVSYVDRVYSEIGKFLSREFQDNIDVFEHTIESRLGVSRQRASLSMAVLTQLTMAAIAMVVGFSVFRDRAWTSYEILQAAGALIIIVIVFNRLLPFVFFARTKGRWLAKYVLLLRLLIYLVLPITLALGFCQSVAALTREHADEHPESPAEAVDALIEAGQEEGILDEGDRDLIQSVVEFGGKTVREAMKPRPDMVAVPTGTTVEKFVELLRSRPFSRVQIADTEARTRTVDSLMRRDVYFVPESKLGSDLLREMQKQNIKMAIVVDEYGGTAGLVTIEDLVEEIVGEIRDEHEKADVVRENDHSYIVPGSMDVDRLDELFGVRPEGKEAATVAGLVSELAGRIPLPGEVIEEDGLRYEVLESTERRVQRVRISMAPRQMKLI